MRVLIRAGVVLAAGILFAAAAVAEDEPDRPATVGPIPFKQTPSPLEDHVPRIATTLVALLGATAVALYLTRRHVSGLRRLAGQGARVGVVERVRLNGRCIIYLVRLDQRELLIAQCGDNVVQLSDRDAAAAAGPAKEEGERRA